MAEFGETTISQTTLASMFPISYRTLIPLMSSRTPQPLAPLAPEKVRPLILAPFSLVYTGFLKIVDLNTELLFLSRAICAPTQSVSGGSGVIGGPILLVDILFNDVTIDDVTVPLVVQGLTLSSNLTFSGAVTSLGILHIGYNTIEGSLELSSDITLASLELYECVVSGDIILPVGASVISMLIYGQYPQISLGEVSNTKVYPSLTSLMYLNGVDGKSPRDIPSGSRGFGAYTLSGLTQTSYPLITTLAVPDPWSIEGLEVLFPNLLTLYAVDYPAEGAVTIPATLQSRYSSLVFIGAKLLTSLDLSNRASLLTGGIRIVGCSSLSGVLLRSEAQTLTPLREYRTLVIERCALLYLRGARGLTRPPAVLRLGDHSSPILTVIPKNATRLLDYVLQALPSVGEGSNVVASPYDYLPNVIVSLAEVLPNLILYPVMQTVEYTLSRSASVVATDPSGLLTSTYTQYSGGANPVVPTSMPINDTQITVSPFGIRYGIRVLTPQSGSAPSAIIIPARDSSKNSVFNSARERLHLDSHTLRIVGIVSIIIGIALIVGVSIVLYRKRNASQNRPPTESREMKLKK